MNAIPVALIKAIAENENGPLLIRGKETHNPAIGMLSCLQKHCRDPEKLENIVLGFSPKIIRETHQMNCRIWSNGP